MKMMKKIVEDPSKYTNPMSVQKSIVYRTLDPLIETLLYIKILFETFVGDVDDDL